MLESSMNFKITKTNLKTIRPEDSNFVIRDGIVAVPRAGFEINQSCPKQYKMIILECLNNGWLKPIATVTERELLFMGLSKNQ